MVIIKSFTATVIGGLLVLSFEPFDLWYLSPFFLAGLWRLLVLESPKNTFVISFFFGLSLWVLGAGWVENSIVNYGGASKLAAYTFVFLIASFLSLFQATSFFFMSLFRLNDHHRLILAFPVFYVFGEYLREFLFTGLPWLYVGYSSLNNFFLNGYIPVIGVFGMSFLICLFASLLGSMIFFQKLRKSHLFLSLVFMSMFALNATWLSTKSWTEKTSSFQAIIVQPNIDVLEKWSRDGQVKSRNYFSKVFFDELIGNENSQEKIIFFWPEVSLPGLFSRFEIFLKGLSGTLKLANAGAVVGMLDEKKDEGYVNSLKGIGILQGNYEKKRLVPFGEYLPMGDLSGYLFNLFQLDRPNIVKGDNNSFISGDGLKIGSSICYEIAYQDDVAFQAKNSDVIFSASNDNWFGTTIGPHQHLQIARYRAAENQKPLLRSTSTGISAAINFRGEVIEQIPTFVNFNNKNESYDGQILKVKINARSGSTPYNENGKYPFLYLILFIFIAQILRRFIFDK